MKKSASAYALAICAAVISLLVPGILRADVTAPWVNQKVNTDFYQSFTNLGSNMTISPDGERVVFQGNLYSTGPTLLYSVPFEGGIHTVLSDGVVGEDEYVSSYKQTPDGQRVIFQVKNEAGKARLYSIPITGGVAILLNGAITADAASIDSFVISSDSLTIYYAAQVGLDPFFRVFKNSILGGSEVNLTAGFDLTSIFFRRILNDKNRLLIIGDTSLNVSNLYSISTNGGASFRLSPEPASGVYGVYSTLLDSTASTVYYSGTFTLPNRYNIYSSRVDAEGSTMLMSSPLIDKLISMQIAPDNSALIFPLKGDMIGDQDVNLYSLSTLGGERISLIPTLERFFAIDTSKISPDSSHIVFGVSQNSSQSGSIYSVPIGGGVPTLLYPPSTDFPKAYSDNLFITSDSNFVVFAAGTHGQRGADILYKVPIAGGPLENITPPSLQDKSWFFELFQAGTMDELIAQEVRPGVQHTVLLHRVNMITGSSTILTDECCADTYFYYFNSAFSADYSNMAYRALQAGSKLNLMYSRSATGGPKTRLTPTDIPIGAGEVSFFKVSPDGKKVVYCANREKLGGKGLFIKDIFGGEETKIHTLGSREFFSDSMVFSDDGSYLVYKGSYSLYDESLLYSSPTDGSLNTYQLCPDTVSPQTYDYKFQIAGSTVIYVLKSSPQLSFNALYSVPISGGTPLLLDKETNLDIAPDFKVTADGSTIIYRRRVTGQTPDYILYKVPVSGGTPEMVMDPVYMTDRTVQQFGFSSDGSRFVFLNRSSAGERRGLYSVPTSGGTPVRLDPERSPGWYIGEFIISPDGKRVAYSSSFYSGQYSFEFLTVPMDGGEPVRVNPDIVETGIPFRNHTLFTPDSSKVIMSIDTNPNLRDRYVYINDARGGNAVKLWDQKLSGVVDLFAMDNDGSHVVIGSSFNSPVYSNLYTVNTDGSGGRILTETAMRGTTAPFKISPDGSRVVFRDYKPSIEKFMLMNYAIDGSSSAEMIPDSVVTESSINAFDFGYQGDVVLYPAIQGTMGTQLFATFDESLPRFSANGWEFH